MLLCEFCDQFRTNGECRLGLNIPRRMGCRSFDPRIKNFCADPADFVSVEQIVQMAVFFDIKGPELKKIKLMATQVEDRLKTGPTPQDEIPLNAPSSRQSFTPE